jgi:hypothetical protein
MPVPADEYPLHQVPLSFRYVATSDRNVYDRCYFNAHDRTGEVFLVTGLGVYPNLGVIDAYAVVRTGNRQVAVRCSDALDERGLDTRVGPYRVEVLEPLQKIRLVCDGDDWGVGFDLTWEGSFPAVDEQPHLMRSGTGRPILDAQRFAQVGVWSGELRVEGQRIEVDPTRWVGTRDRSWGIRPVGEPEPPGRAGDEPLEGFWWLYVPLRFDDCAVIVICQEEPDGFRTLNDATLVGPDGRVGQLGWPEVSIAYRSGTRLPTGARIGLRDRRGAPMELEVETLGSVVLHYGGGYGADPGWTHGSWRGRDWVEGVSYDMDDPEIVAMSTFGVIDHVARAVLRHPDGEREGWGLFEHGTFGRHDPSGFVDFGSVAP